MTLKKHVHRGIRSSPLRWGVMQRLVLSFGLIALLWVAVALVLS